MALTGHATQQFIIDVRTQGDVCAKTDRLLENKRDETRRSAGRLAAFDVGLDRLLEVLVDAV